MSFPRLIGHLVDFSWGLCWEWSRDIVWAEEHGHAFRLRDALRFGSTMGGDRHGHFGGSEVHLLRNDVFELAIGVKDAFVGGRGG